MWKIQTQHIFHNLLEPFNAKTTIATMYNETYFPEQSQVNNSAHQSTQMYTANKAMTTVYTQQHYYCDNSAL